MNVDPRFAPAAGRQRVFNLPPVLVAVIAVLFAVHAIREYVLSNTAALEFLLWLAFIPGRTFDAAIAAAIPGGEGARLWTFLTYALLHGDWAHLIFNTLWLAAFGGAVAWRFGTWRFLGFSAVGAVAGSALHLGLYPTSMVPLVGASAAISAHMAAAARFAFTSGGLGFQNAGPAAYRRPAPPLSMALRDRRVLTFLGAWLITNLLFGLYGAGSVASGAVAWEAHLGGFIAGLLFFPVFDPVRLPRR